MTDPVPNATTDSASTKNDSTQAPATGNPTPAPASTSGDSFTMADLKRELDGFGERMVSGIREAFPAPVVAAPPAGSNPKAEDETKPDPKPEVKPQTHPTPGEHGGGKLAAWWFGSKR